VLSGNLAAIHLLEKNLEKIDWFYLSGNKAIIEFDIEQYKKDSNVSVTFESLVL